MDTHHMDENRRLNFDGYAWRENGQWKLVLLHLPPWAMADLSDTLTMRTHPQVLVKSSCSIRDGKVDSIMFTTWNGGPFGGPPVSTDPRILIFADEVVDIRNSLAIWWLDQLDIDAINEQVQAGDFEKLPEYLQDQFRSLSGRPKRGRLWVTDAIPIESIDWPSDNVIAKRVEEHGGIVFWRKDIESIRNFPGILTDLKFNRL